MLTNHQNEKLNKLLDLLKTNPIVLIKGSAGVGKTYLVDTLLKNLRGKIYVTAPTHKAVAVLVSKITTRTDVEFLTTHSALKYAKKIDNKTGTITFEPVYNEKFPPLSKVKYLVIDECSMVDSNMKAHIEYHAKMQNTKVIFLGDDKQLNPVGEEDSCVFNSNYPEVELTEIIRQGLNNPIIDLSRNLEKIQTGVSERNEDNNGYIFSNTLSLIISHLAYHNGSDYLKYLSYTNVEVDKINNMVRKYLYESPNKLEEGETIVLNANYKDLYVNNQDLKIEKLMVLEKTFKVLIEKYEEKYIDLKLKVYSINPVIIEESEFSEKEINHKIYCIHEESEKDLKAFIKEYKERAKFASIDWKTYYSFLEEFIDFKYNHALTIHKSQGSTFKQCILNIKDINKCQSLKEKKRLLYTGVTRASNLIILYNI